VQIYDWYDRLVGAPAEQPSVTKWITKQTPSVSLAADRLLSILKIARDTARDSDRDSRPQKL